MRNGLHHQLESEQDCGPELEERIRAYLPSDVLKFAEEKSSVPYSWISLYKSVRDRGAQATIRIMRHNNAVIHRQAHGPKFHNFLSPWRDY